MAIDTNRMLQLGQIAKVGVDAMTDAQRDALSSYGNQLLERFAKVQDPAIDDAVPLIHPGDPQTWMRDDEVQASLGARRALDNAPARHDNFFHVPRVVDDNQ